MPTSLTARWIACGLILGLFVSVLLAWSLTRSGLLDPHRLGLLMVCSVLLSVNLVVVPVLYWWDKRKARVGEGMRIPEVVLHSFAFAGGGLGALVSQRLLRHKTRKRGFTVVTWIALASNVGLLYLGLRYFGLV